jgi:hypothetical protein
LVPDDSIVSGPSPQLIRLKAEATAVSVVVLVALIFFARWAFKKPNDYASKQQFTPEQLVFMQGLVRENLQSIEESKQTIIDKGAHEGKTIATETVLRHLDASKAAHQGADREAYTAAADKLAREFREKYPDTIPVDEAYRLMKEWE